jgi:hypothetical protein
LAEVPLRPFELEIVESYKVFNPMEGRGGKATPHKGVWIRGHLQTVRGKEDYPYGMWRRWVAFTEIARNLEARIEAGSYTSFRLYIWLLKRAGLITPTRKRPAMKTPLPEFMRQYYTLNPAMLGSPVWLNPYSQYESWRRWKGRKFKRPGAVRRKKPVMIRVVKKKPKELG